MKTNKSQKGINETEKHKQLIVDQKEYIVMLEKLMAFISHNIRQPMTQIMNLSYLVQSGTDNPLQLNKKIMHVKQTALLLEKKSKELSILICKKIISLKKAEEARIIKKPIIR